ncbi:zinc-ribbon domain-containing protein [Candidatus Pelagibacter sp.]|nr:zinc-ribbon domain-containing protein [Candidatus Pelagibacter sp.]
MIIDCICGKKKFRLADGVMPAEGSKVRCGSCSEVWFYHPNEGSSQTTEESFKTEPTSSPVEENVVEAPATTEEPTSVEDPTEPTVETPPADDPEELLSTIDNDAVTKEVEEEKRSEDTVSNFKIFTDEDKEFPSKEEMDRNLDNLTLERDKNLNFFQKLFKKDRLKEAAKALEKKKKQQQSEEEKNKIDVARRTRLLFYLLILLFIVFSVLIVPLREEVGMAFPFMEKYLEFLIPMYDYIKGPLGFE